MVIISLSDNLPGRLRCLMPSFPTEGRRRFLESSSLKFLSNSSIIQKISVTLSLVIIACLFCNVLIFNHKYTKYQRDYQFLFMFASCFFLSRTRVSLNCKCHCDSAAQLYDSVTTVYVATFAMRRCYHNIHHITKFCTCGFGQSRGTRLCI